MFLKKIIFCVLFCVIGTGPLDLGLLIRIYLKRKLGGYWVMSLKKGQTGSSLGLRHV